MLKNIFLSLGNFFEIFLFDMMLLLFSEEETSDFLMSVNS